MTQHRCHSRAGGNPEKCNCLLCKPVQGKRPHLKWGYDLDAVKNVLCLLCSRPIGTSQYKEDTTLARFGEMFFVHENCEVEK
jgi:hypothetical protein